MARPGAVAAATLALLALPSASAQAGLLGSLPIPLPPELETILDPVTDPVDATIDDVLEAAGLGDLLSPAPGTAPGGSTADPGAPATTTGPGGPTGGGAQAPAPGPSTGVPGVSVTDASGQLVDAVAPVVQFKVVSKLRRAARTGRLRVRVTSSEAGVVAFKALLRPGKARRVKGRPLKVTRLLLETPSTVVPFRASGSTTVAVKLPPLAKRTFPRVKNARMSLQAWATDLARNQTRKNVKRTLRR